MDSDSRDAVFSPKDPDEIIPVSFDFATFGSSGFTSPVITVTYLSGITDASPSTMVVILPSVTGSIVTAGLGGGVDGTDYLVRCQVTNSALVYVLSAVLPVRLAQGRYSQTEILD